MPDFQGNEDEHPHGARGAPGDLQPQHRDGAAPLQEVPSRRPLSSACCEIFRFAKRIAPDIPTKTGIILGMGETIEEVLAVMRDLREVDVDILTLGQYLRPSDGTSPLDRYVTPDEFRALRETGWRWASGTSNPARSCAPAITPGSRCRPPASEH